MATAVSLPPGTLTREASHAWAARRRGRRFALADGRVIAIASEHALHARTKLALAPSGSTLRVEDLFPPQPEAEPG